MVARCAVLESFATAFQAHGLSNFIYSDGELLFAHSDRRPQPNGSIGPPGLHVLTRACSLADGSVSAAGLNVEAEDIRVVLIASVPLTDENWRPLAEGETVSVAAGGYLNGA